MQRKTTPKGLSAAARQAAHDASTGLCHELASRHPEIKERPDAFRRYRKANERMTQLQAAGRRPWAVDAEGADQAAGGGRPR